MKAAAAASAAVLLAGSTYLAFLFRGEVPWPFPLRPSLVVLEDPDLRREVGSALLAVAAGLGAYAVALFARRLRWPAAALAAVAVAWAAPHLRLLLVEAYPTSYYASPTGFAGASIAHGRALFAGACASCHGADGRGDGPLAKALVDPPADLTAPHLWDHGDGEVFWWLTHGIDGPEGGLVMPGFAATLSVGDRWDLIDYVRAHNAGVALRETGSWPRPVPAPGFTARCPDGTTVGSDDLLGRVVRLVVAGGHDRPAPLPQALAGIDIVDVYTPARPDAAEGCVADAPALADALAVLTGDAREAVAGDEFLVDPEGRLRARHRAGARDGWSDTATVLAAVGQICRHRMPANGGDDAQIR